MNRKLRRTYERKYGNTQALVKKTLVQDSRSIINKAAKAELDRVREEAFNDVMNQAMLLTLVLPAKVLMQDYQLYFQR